MSSQSVSKWSCKNSLTWTSLAGVGWVTTATAAASFTLSTTSSARHLDHTVVAWKTTLLWRQSPTRCRHSANDRKLISFKDLLRLWPRYLLSCSGLLPQHNERGMRSRCSRNTLLSFHARGFVLVGKNTNSRISMPYSRNFRGCGGRIGVQ